MQVLEREEEKESHTFNVRRGRSRDIRRWRGPRYRRCTRWRGRVCYSRHRWRGSSSWWRGWWCRCSGGRCRWWRGSSSGCGSGYGGERGVCLREPSRYGAHQWLGSAAAVCFLLLLLFLFLVFLRSGGFLHYCVRRKNIFEAKKNRHRRRKKDLRSDALRCDTTH